MIATSIIAGMWPGLTSSSTSIQGIGLRWAAACYHQDVTALIVRDLVGKSLKVLSYIDNFGDVADSEKHAQQHFDLLHAILAHLGM